MQTTIFNLINLGLIEINGSDAAKFLQGQLTCNVLTLNEQQNYIGAHCDPKGRIQAIFRLFQWQSNYYFLLPKHLIPNLLQSLHKYAVFSKVKLTDVSEQWHCVGVQGEIPFKKGDWIKLVVSEPNFRNILLSKTLTADALSTNQIADEKAWQLLDIQAGIPTINPETIGEFTPHDLNLQLIDGISFNKGCYTGQEIIARMHYLGKLKQQMYRVAFSSNDIIKPNTKLYNLSNQEVGNIVTIAPVTTHQFEALAVLQKSAVSNAIHVAKENGPLLSILDLPYTA